MPSQGRDPSCLADIMGAARQIAAFIGGVDKAAFLEDPMRQSAVVRQLEIIGEATKRLSEQFRADHPSIPWRAMAGMRDILIHAYDHVDPNEVWKAASVSVPALLESLEPLLESGDPDR